MVIDRQGASLSYDTAADAGIWAAEDTVVAAGESVTVAPLSTHNLFDGITENEIISANYFGKLFRKGV